MRIDDEKQLEEILKDLPEFKMRKSADARFYGKLLKTYLLSTPFPASRTFAGAFVIAVLLIFGATAFSIQPSVTRGHFLYPFKRAEERVELYFTKNPLSLVKTHLKFADRRLEEIKTLVAERNEARLINAAYAQNAENEVKEPENLAVIETTAQDMVNSTEAAMKTAEIVEDANDAMSALNEISKTHEKQVRTLTFISEKASPKAKEAFRKTVETTNMNYLEVASAKGMVLQALKTSEKRVKIKLEVSKEREAKAKQKTEELKTEIEEMKKEFTEKSVPPEKINKVLQRVEEKLEAAEQALSEGKIKQAQGLSNATEALTNNAKSFLKKTEEKTGEKEKIKEEKPATGKPQAKPQKPAEQKGKGISSPYTSPVQKETWPFTSPVSKKKK